MYLWLISAGLTIIFGVLRIVNFAHGSLFMVGAYLAYTFYGQMGLPFAIAIVLSLLGTGVLGYVMERVFLRRLYGVDEAYQLLLDLRLHPDSRRRGEDHLGRALQDPADA